MSIEVKDLTKSYGSIHAVQSVSFGVKSGEIVGFLGPNGAGKTTTMKMLSGILSPTSGTAFVNGYNIQTEHLDVRKQIGYLPENNPLYLELTVYEYLEYCADIFAVGKSEIPHRIAEMVETCGLQKVYHRPIGTLSKGYKQRVGLAQSLIHHPSVLILDEPTTGLDPNQILEIRDLIKRLGAEKTVILSTHILQEVEAICNRVLIINDGQIVADGTPQELENKFRGGTTWYLEIEGNLNAFQDRFQQVFSHIGMEVIRAGDKIHLLRFNVTSETEFNKKLFRFCTEQPIELLQLYKEESNLEDIFRLLTVASTK